MTSIQIKQKIEGTISAGSYPSWTIGLTDEPTITRAKYENPECWHSWEANTVQDAKSVQDHFVKKNMRSNNSSGSAPKYVYIF